MNLKNEEDFLVHIHTEIQNNRLLLPTLPDVALQVREMVNRGDASAQQLVKIIATDTALSARLIQVVNSPLYRGRRTIDTLQAAISRLGNKTVRTLVTSLVIQQVFNPSSKAMEKYFRSIWETSVNVSAMSHALACRCPNLDAEQAMLAGLIHQIGKLPILMLAEQIPELLADEAALEQLVEKIHPRIGKLIVDAWDFPEAIRPVAWIYMDFSRDAGPEPDYIDIVQVAYLETVVRNLSPANQPDWDSIPAFRKLGLSPEIEVLEIEGLSDEIDNVQALLI